LTEMVRRQKLRELSKSIPLVREVEPRLAVVYEDEWFLVVNKPSGVRTHPVHRFEGGSLLNWVLGYLDVGKIHTVHRLDQQTSGLVIFAKNPTTAEAVNAQFRDRLVRKQYLSIVDGTMPETDPFFVDAPIARCPTDRIKRRVDNAQGKPSRTQLTVLSTTPTASLLLAQPLSGRTHQIRLHARHAGFPIVGDDLYGTEAMALERQGAVEDVPAETQRLLAAGDCLRRDLKLHAFRLQLQHPCTGETMVLGAPPPPHFAETAAAYGVSAAIPQRPDLVGNTS